MIRAEVRTTYVSTPHWRGTPKVVFDAEGALKELSEDMLRAAVALGFESGYGATDAIAQEATRYDEDVAALFDMLSAAGKIGVDLGGHDTEVLDKKEALGWVLDHRPDVLETFSPDERAASDEFLNLLKTNDLL